MNLQETFIREIQEHSALINKLVFLYADLPEDRRDLHQEILLQAWKSYPGFRRESKFSTWLYRVALNVSLTSLRRKPPSTHSEWPEEPSVGPTLEASDQLEVVLHSLSPLDRTLLVMSMEGYSQEEIAETLGLSAGNLRIKLYRIRKKVQQQWK